jgi:hypothetical protein
MYRLLLLKFCSSCAQSFCRIAVCKHNNGSILQTLVAHGQYIADDKVNCTLLRLIGQDTAVFLLKRQSCVIDRLSLAARVEMDNFKLSSDAPVLAAQALKRLFATALIHFYWRH